MSPKKVYTTEDVDDDWLLKGFELIPPFNVAQMADEVIEEFGEGAADHAQSMARLARGLNNLDAAEDYEQVHRLILEHNSEQGKN